MMGRRSGQKDLFDVSPRVAPLIEPGSIYHLLHHLGPTLLRDSDFAHLYCANNGRPSHPPSLMAGVLLLQRAEGVSDREAIERLTFDTRWKYALHLPIDYRAFPNSNLAHFRARLITADLDEQLLGRLNELAVELEILDPEGEQAVDSSHIFGAAAVQDTYELLRSGLRGLLEEMLEEAPGAAQKLITRYGLSGHLSEEKPDIDWSDPEERSQWLARVVKDARALLGLLDCHPLAASSQVREAAKLLADILAQDITAPEEEGPEGPSITRGVAKDRILSTVDPEMRHGHKSSSVRFDGHKAQISVDTRSELITSVVVTPGNRPDSEGLTPLLRQHERLYGTRPARMIGDSQYGPIEKRQQLQDEGIELVAKCPPPPSNGERFSKEDFEINLEEESVTCPAGQTTSTYHATTDGKGRERKVFRFDGPTCQACALRERCTTAKNGRSVSVHPYETEREQLRAFQKTESFDRIYRRRPVVERRNAHLFWWHDLRQSRYIGRRKTQLQALLTAVVVNLKTLGDRLLEAALGTQPALGTAV